MRAGSIFINTAVAIISSCSTIPSYVLPSNYAVNNAYVSIVENSEINHTSKLINATDNLSIVNSSEVHKLDSYMFNLKLFNERLSLYKKYFSDYDENEQFLCDLLHEDEKLASFNEFLKYIFKSDDLYVCDNFLTLLLGSDFNIFNGTFKDVLEICKNSKNRSLVRKANSIFKCYFES